MPAQNPPGQQGASNADAVIKLEEPSLHQQLQSIDWDSERQLISSLSKLQQLESKIHELRSLLPDRLLAPLSPIVNPCKTGSTNSIPRNPQILNAHLKKSATEGVAEVNSFKDLWLSPDMQAVWSRMDEKLAESKGRFPQPSGMWQYDYHALLKEMDEEENKAANMQQIVPDSSNEQQRGPVRPPAVLSIYGTRDIVEREGGWKTVVETFQKRQIPGFRLASSKNESMIIVNLGLAGITFEIQEVLTTTTSDATISSDIFSPMMNTSTSGTGTKQALPEWRVSARQSLGKSGPSRLETAIVQELNSRPRKWDLHYLLELILAYSNIRSTPCQKCNQLTDSTAQLPIIRTPVSTNNSTTMSTLTVPENNKNNTTKGDSKQPSSDISKTTGNEAGVVWEAYHTECA